MRLIGLILSLGLVTWVPTATGSFAGNMPHLAVQMQAAADKALISAQTHGGNRTAVVRLNPRTD